MEPVCTPGKDASDVAGSIRPEFSIAFAEAVDALCDDMRLRELSARHIGNVRNMALRAARLAGWDRLDDMTTDSITGLLRKLRGDGVAPKTRNEYRSILHTLGAFALRNQWLGLNPAQNTPRAKVPKRQARKVPSIDEVRRLIETAKTDWRSRDRWLVYLTAATTGMRWGQLKGLEWGHVRLFDDPPRLTLPARLCKNGEPSTVWLTAELADHLRVARVVEYAFKSSREGPPERVFRSVPKRDVWLKDFKKAGMSLGGGDDGVLSFHSLRHFASNRMKWMGFTDAERQTQNQHLTPAMTAETYTDPAHFELGRKVFQMPGLCGDAGGSDGKMRDLELTSAGKIDEDSTGAMTTTPTQLDLQAPTDLPSVIAPNFDGGSAGASEPRTRGNRLSQWAQQDSNL